MNVFTTPVSRKQSKQQVKRESRSFNNDLSQMTLKDMKTSQCVKYNSINWLHTTDGTVATIASKAQKILGKNSRLLAISYMP